MEPDESAGGPDPAPATRSASSRRRLDLLPVLLLAGIVLVLLAGWWLFPLLHNELAYQDCLAAGRTDCFGPPPK